MFLKVWIIKGEFISQEYKLPLIIIYSKVYLAYSEHHIGAVLTVAKDIVLPDIKNHVTFYLHLYAHDI